MTQFNVAEAKARFSELVQKAVSGEEVVIAKAGRPVARLVPARTMTKPSRLGAFEGQIRIHDDFDELPADIQGAFEGGA